MLSPVRCYSICFNPRPPAEGDPIDLPVRYQQDSAFQSTPSCGGRRILYALHVDNARVSIHALLRRATSSVPTSWDRFTVSIHALLRRATTIYFYPSTGKGGFNPRPPAEGDIYYAR